MVVFLVDRRWVFRVDLGVDVTILATSTDESTLNVAWAEGAHGRSSPLSFAPLERFRTVAGLALAIHFACHAVGTAPLFEWLRLTDVARLGPGTLPAEFTMLLSSTVLRAGFALGAVLSACTALGFFPRVTAAVVYGISALTYRALYPLADLNDYVANVTALFLALSPVGCELWRLRNRESRGRSRGRSEGSVSTAVFLTYISVLYVTYGFGDFPSLAFTGSQYVEVAIRMIPAAYVLPIPGLPVVGLLLQLIAQVGWFTRSAGPSNVVLLASGFLFWQTRQKSKFDGRRPIGASDVVSVACVFVPFVAAAAFTLGLPSKLPLASRITADAGLVPPFGGPLPIDPGRLFIHARTFGADPSTSLPLPAWGRIAQRVASDLVGRQYSRADRLTLASALAAGYCRAHGYLGQSASLTWSNATDERTIADFECGLDGGVATIR